MSDCYFVGNNSQTERTSAKEAGKASLTDNNPSWVPRNAVVWTPDLENSLTQFFTKLDYPFRHYFDIPFQDPLRSEIRRFFLSLDAYIESPNPVIPYRDILYGSARKDYALTLKRIKRKSFETTWNVEHFAYPDWWKDVPAYPIKDIGDIFNYSYLIFWKMDDPDDYTHGFTDTSVCPSTLNLFKKTLKDILPLRDSFEKIDTREIISQISSSMSIKRGESKHLPHYMIKDKFLYLAKSIGTCERVVLQVSPENCRDSVLVDPAALNTISAIDQQLMEILRVMPGHIHLRDKDEVTRRMTRLCKFRFFLQRDIKKEGITKPRELLKAMLEVLHEEYPDIEQFGYTSFYDDFSIRKDGEVIYPKRGHGLGMANALTTLMQLVIHEMIVDDLTNDIPEIKAKALTLNDDFVVAFHDEYHVDQYWDKEDYIMNLLSIIRAPDKSFYSELRYVLAERYFVFGSEYEKISYQRRECLLPLACTNIVHAKEYFRSVQTYVNSSLALTYIDEIQNFWGYEFYPNEFNYPYIVGGWRNERIGAVDLSLLELDHLDYNSNISRGFYASKITTHKKKKGDYYQSPFIILNGFPNIPEEYYENVDFLPMSRINDKYGRILSKSDNEFRNYWTKLKRMRMAEFKKPCQIPYESLIKEILISYKTTQFYPCEMMIDHYAQVDVIDTNVRDIYIDANPRMSMLAKYNSIAYPFKEDFSIQFSNPDAFTKKTSGLYSKEVERTLKNEALAVMFTGKFHEVYIPRDEKPQELYLNPFKIGHVASIIDWGKGYPIISEDYRHTLLDKKYEVYNRIFSMKEQIMLSQAKLSRINIKIIADYMNNNPQESLDSIIDYIVESINENLPIPTSDNEDEDMLEFEDETLNRSYLQNERAVSIEDFYTDSSKLWTMLSENGEYQFIDNLSQRVFNDIKILYTISNIQFGDSIFELNDIKMRLLESYGPRVAFIVKRCGILDTTSTDILDNSDPEDQGLGLLWDG